MAQGGLMDFLGSREFAMYLSGLGGALSRADRGEPFDMSRTNQMLMQQMQQQKMQEKTQGLMGQLSMSPQQQAIMEQYAQYDPRGAMGVLAEQQFAGGPDPTAGMREYEFARQNGFQGSFMDFLEAKRAGTNVNVSTGDTGPRVGSIPQGYQLVQTPEGAWQMAPIPGGPAAREIAETEEKQARAKEAQTSTVQRYGGVVLEDIGRVKEKLKTFGLPETGMGGYLLKNIPGTDAYNVRALTETIRANIGFDRLQQMREASPTGGALGQVTERELAFLQATLGNLDQAQDEEDFLYNLNRLEKIYKEIMRKASAYPNAAEFGFGGAEGAGGSAKPVTELTDEELKKALGID